MNFLFVRSRILGVLGAAIPDPEAMRWASQVKFAGLQLSLIHLERVCALVKPHIVCA